MPTYKVDKEGKFITISSYILSEMLKQVGSYNSLYGQLSFGKNSEKQESDKIKNAKKTCDFNKEFLLEVNKEGNSLELRGKYLDDEDEFLSMRITVDQKAKEKYGREDLKFVIQTPGGDRIPFRDDSESLKELKKLISEKRQYEGIPSLWNPEIFPLIKGTKDIAAVLKAYDEAVKLPNSLKEFINAFCVKNGFDVAPFPSRPSLILNGT